MSTWILYRIGFALKETGQALDRVGCRLQGNSAFLEEFWRHRPLMNLLGRKPAVAPDAFVAPSASVIGEVQLGPKSSIWYGAVLRGDAGKITVGSNTNLQDGVVVRTVALDLGGHSHGTVIGNNVTVGHNAALHSCTIADNSLIGMGATLQEGVTVEEGSMVAAGAVVSAGTTIPSGQLWGGNPAKFMRNLKPEEASFLPASAQHYTEVAAEHKQALSA